MDQQKITTENLHRLRAKTSNELLISHCVEIAHKEGWRGKAFGDRIAELIDQELAVLGESSND